MAKIDLNEVKSGFNLSKINDNFQKIASVINERILFRNNIEGEPNQMHNDLDLNGKRVYNLPEPVAEHEAARKKDVDEVRTLTGSHRTLRVDDVNIPALPDASARRNKFLAFDNNGDPVANTVVASFPEIAERTQKSLLVFETTPEASIAAMALPDGQVVDVSASNTRYTVSGGLLVDERPTTPVSVASGVVRSVQSKLREFVTPQDFGAVGDGIADDTAAIQAFLESNGPLHWGNKTYRITSQLSVTVTKNFTWESLGAKIIVDPLAPIESALKINTAGHDVFLSGNINIDCNNRTFAGILVINSSSVFSSCEIDGPIIRNVYRSSTLFNYGDGIYVFGAYSRVVVRNFEVRGVKMAVGAGVPFSYGVTGVSVVRANNSTRDAEFVLIEDFLIDGVYSEDTSYGARDQDGVRIQQAYAKSESPSYTNPASATVQNGKIKNALGRAVKMVSEYGVIKNIHIVRNREIRSGFKPGSSEDFDFQVSGGSISGIRCYYNDNCPESVATFSISLQDERRSPTSVIVDDVVVSAFGFAPTRLVDIDVISPPIPAIVQVNISNVQVSGSLLQLNEITRLRNQNNVPTSLLNFYILLTNVSSRVERCFVWRENPTLDNTTSVTGINCVKLNPTSSPLVTGALTTNIFSSLVGQNLRLT